MVVVAVVVVDPWWSRLGWQGGDTGKQGDRDRERWLGRNLAAWCIENELSKCQILWEWGTTAAEHV